MDSAINTYMGRKSNINGGFFTNCSSKESAYLLGLLWADGWTNQNTNQVAIECCRDDLEIIKPVFDKSGLWLDSYRARPNRKPQMNLRGSSGPLSNLLKSCKSSNELLHKIPQEYQPYFVQGLFDGDGCIYLNPKYSTFQVSITSHLTENWDIKEYLKENGIGVVSIRRVESKNSYSVLRITNRKDCRKFYELIYQMQPPIGLRRKWVKLNSITVPQ